MSRKKVIQEIVVRHRAKLPLTIEAIQAEANDLYEHACEHFGTWETALQYAGISIRRIHNIKQAGTKEELARAIKDLPEEIRMSRAKFVVKHYRRIYVAAIEHHGSWCAAVRAAGYERPTYIRNPASGLPKADSERSTDALQTSPPHAQD